MAACSSAEMTAGKSSMPESMRKALKPMTPASINGSRSARLPGIRPPRKPQSTCNCPRAAASLVSSASTVVVTGVLFRGMSARVVMPPAAAALVAVSKPSQAVRPGSLICTWLSTRPGINTRSPRSVTAVSGGDSSSRAIAMIRPSATSTVPGRTPSGRTTRRLRRARSMGGAIIRPSPRRRRPGPAADLSRLLQPGSGRQC